MSKEEENKNPFKGPSMGYSDNFPKREMWKEIAKEQNGEFKIKYNSGNELEIHHIKLPHKKWEISISVSDSRPLKFEVSFKAEQNFELFISWEDFIERILNKFSKADIKAGWKDFDKHYIIKSNRSDLAIRILNREIQRVFLKYNVYSLSYTTETDAGKAKLLSVIQRNAGNKEMILELLDMFKRLIDNLENSGIIK